jgi:thiamine biosynthesis lipoprotein
LDNQGGTLVDLYQHYQTATNTIPPDGEIRETLVLVDYRNTAVEGNRASFRHPGMAMTLDGITKGYIVDEGGGVLKQHGLGDVLVEAGGDLLASGQKEPHTPW